jgi:hypothetical protein
MVAMPSSARNCGDTREVNSESARRRAVPAMVSNDGERHVLIARKYRGPQLDRHGSKLRQLFVKGILIEETFVSRS